MRKRQDSPPQSLQIGCGPASNPISGFYFQTCEKIHFHSLKPLSSYGSPRKFLQIICFPFPCTIAPLGPWLHAAPIYTCAPFSHTLFFIVLYYPLLSLVYTHQLSYNVLLPKVALLAVLLIFRMLKTVSMWVEQCWCDNEWRKWPPYSGAQRTVLNYCVSIRKHIELCSLMGTVRVWFLRTWV